VNITVQVPPMPCLTDGLDRAPRIGRAVAEVIGLDDVAAIRFRGM
jgi:hypothetical protein